MRDDRSRSSRFIGLATIGVAVYAAYIPLNTLWRIAVDPVDPDASRYAVAVAAVACYLPFHLWLVVSGARAEHRRGQRWALAAAAVVVLGALPVLGADWIGAVESLAALVLIALPPRWSLVLYGAMVAATAPVTIAFGSTPSWGVYFTAGMLCFPATVAAPVWLLTAVRELQAARLALAQEAIVRERLRIDDELGRTLGAALESIVAGGDEAGALAAADPPASARRLGVLVDGTRRTLAESRRMVGRYRTAPAVAEVESAARLLTAAGIQTRVLLPPVPPLELSEQLLAELRSGVARLLVDRAVRRCDIELSRQAGRLRFDLRADGHDPSTTEAAAS